MQSFDFDSLNSEDQQQTFAFLDLPNNTPMPWQAFPDPMMEASFATMPFGLTDETPFQQLSQPPVQWEMSIGLQQSQVAQVTHVDDESSVRPNQIGFHCDWPLCNSQAQYDIHELESHKMQDHIADVLVTWPGRCSWPGCFCKAFFKTSKRLEAHVFNIHVTPLCCAIDGCTHRRPFERQADLDRHVASKHTKERMYKCLHPKCCYSFTRKDKFKLHQKNFHERFACQYNHYWDGFASDYSLRNHVGYLHRHGYECALGSCANTSPSMFWWHGITQHLVDAHGCLGDVARATVIMPYLLQGTQKVTIADFPDEIPDFKDCEKCKKKLKEAEEAKVDEETNN